ncbi:MFS transporter [Streptomyces albiaxialis]|uniref:MFS transporter n=1 Tax=Streptomyces albiaxialis TaxID=329523 RepID=A0ABP5HDE9_9ACTN
MPSPRPAAPSYAAVLRTPSACRTFGAALLGRLSYGMVPLSLILAAKDVTGSYASAGGVMAAFGATAVLLSPARAALIDRHGPRRALPPMAAVYAALLVVLALATSGRGLPALPLALLAGAAGSCAPPLGPVMRSLWSVLVPERDLLRRAYSLDGVAEELLLVTGPLLVGLLVRFSPPSAGLAVSAVLVLTGALALATAPAVREQYGRKNHGRKAGEEEPGPALGGAGLARAVTAAAGVGMSLGALDLLVIAFADAHHAPGTVPWALAALSAGSAVGGLVHGAVPWRLGSAARLPLLAAALGLVLAVAGLSPGPYALIGWTAAAGLFVAPAITTAYLLADESAPPHARTRAGAWVNTALNAGTSAATAAVGHAVGHLPLPLCFALAAAPPVLSAGAALFIPRGRDGNFPPEFSVVQGAVPSGVETELR